MGVVTSIINFIRINFMPNSMDVVTSIINFIRINFIPNFIGVVISTINFILNLIVVDIKHFINL